MEYYYTQKENVFENSLVITDAEAKHLNKVLRKQTGQEIFVTDGLKNVYKTVIENLNVLDYDYYFKVTGEILSGNISP